MSDFVTRTGKVYSIIPVTAKGNPDNPFLSGAIVLEVPGKYADFLTIEFGGDSGINTLNSINEGDEVEVKFSLRGRKYNKKDGSGEGFFNSLSGFAAKVVGSAATTTPPAPQQEYRQAPAPNPQAFDDDLPF